MSGLTDEQLAEITAAIEGLLEIAETAMPDTYFATDSRVQAARKALETLHAGGKGNQAG